LNFPGTTEEAFRYYETVFGTRIVMMQMFGETPFIENPPEGAKKKIMHAQLPITEAVHLMGSDSVEGIGHPLNPGNNFHISVVARDKAEADRAFAALSRERSSEVPSESRALGQAGNDHAARNKPGWAG
jgi:PhnB protein